MKILILTLFVYFPFFAAYSAWAGTNTLVANYPAPTGSYNRVVLSSPPPATTDTTCSTTNAGLLFMSPDTYAITNQDLEICAASPNGTNTYSTPSFPQVCFNRFCSTKSGTSCFTSHPICPTGYAQLADNGVPLGIPNNPDGTAMPPDQLTADSGFFVYSTVCCSIPNPN